MLLEFIEGTIKADMPNEEKFSNVKIVTDGDVASVNFDYVYLEK
jgi:hypothetical protein